MPAIREDKVYEFGEFRLDAAQCRLFRHDGDPLPLTSRAFDTLLFMVKNRGELLDKDSLMNAVWPNTVVDENNLNQSISVIRKTLGETPGDHRYIVTVPGRGYRFVASVQEVTAAAPAQQRQGPPEHAVEDDLLPDKARRTFAQLVSLISVAALAVMALVAMTLMLQQGPQGGPSAATRAAVLVGEPSVAVLPFVDLSPNKDKEYFAEGLSEELLNTLARIHGLKVTARTSSFAFKGKPESIKAIGRRLGVSTVLEGSVRIEGDQLRVTAQLVGTEDEYQLWAGSYDRKLTDIFAVQDQISAAVAEALSVTLGLGDAGSMAGGTHNAAAYDHYLAGVSEFRRFTNESGYRALPEMRTAVDMDPNFALAWVALSNAYRWNGLIAPATLSLSQERAREATMRAIAIAPDLPDARLALVTDYLSRRDWLEARKASEGLGVGRATLQVLVGQEKAALPEMLARVERDPLNISASTSLLFVLDSTDDLEAAKTEFARQQRLEGGPTETAEIYHIIRLLEAGDMAGRNLLAARVALDPVTEGDLGAVAARRILTLLDDPPAARAAVRELFQDEGSPDKRGIVELAAWAAFLRDPETAIAALRTALLEGPIGKGTVLWIGVMKHVRGDPRFKDLVRDLGLVDYWRKTGAWGDFCHPVGDTDFECQ